jgi:HAD superfamily hydrolase (TIGR01509 family)
VTLAILFDVDGTLVDSVDLHAHAWQEAFAHFGKRIPYREIRAQIGKGGDQLIPVFLDEAERERMGERLESFRGDLFRREYLPRVRPFPHARDLVRRVKDAGLRAGLASSAKGDELDHHLDLVGLRGLVDAATTADDVERSKPHPDVFTVCAAKLGVDPRDVIAVGDSPFDAIAARRAGARAVGLLAGGFPRAALAGAGCEAIYADAGDLLLRFDGSPLAPSEARAGA